MTPSFQDIISAAKDLTIILGIVTLVWSLAWFLRGLTGGVKSYFEAEKHRLEILGRLALASERSAAALEKSVTIIPLLEEVHNDRREIGISLRAMSRKINQLLAEKENVEEPVDR